MEFEWNKYINLLYEKRFKEALIYRGETTPKKLYKYVSLSNEFNCNKDNLICYRDNKLNEDKLTCLEKKKIWLSRFKNLNDPFEYKLAYIRYDKLSAKGWDKQIVDKWFDTIRNYHLVSSFTTNIDNNMPMWAHYCNNHQGFCIEYDILNPQFIYPISYEKERVGIASIITNTFNKMEQFQKGQIDEMDEEYQMYLTLMIHFATVKHESWEYENEYRVVYGGDYSENNFGMSISESELGLKVSRIFLGYQCSEENKKRIIKIARTLQIEINETYLDEKDFKLRYKII